MCFIIINGKCVSILVERAVLRPACVIALRSIRGSYRKSKPGNTGSTTPAMIGVGSAVKFDFNQ